LAVIDPPPVRGHLAGSAFEEIPDGFAIQWYSRDPVRHGAIRVEIAVVAGPGRREVTDGVIGDRHRRLTGVECVNGHQPRLWPEPDVESNAFRVVRPARKAGIWTAEAGQLPEVLARGVSRPQFGSAHA